MQTPALLGQKHPEVSGFRPFLRDFRLIYADQLLLSSCHHPAASFLDQAVFYCCTSPRETAEPASHPGQGCSPRPPSLGMDALARSHVQAACWLGSPVGNPAERAVSSGYRENEVSFALLCARARPGDRLWGGQVAPLH